MPFGARKLLSECRSLLANVFVDLDILLAPNGARSYPNLTDHRGNVRYDVMRVVRLMADTRFTTGDLYARGRWVVVPCRLAIEPRQEGGS